MDQGRKCVVCNERGHNKRTCPSLGNDKKLSMEIQALDKLATENFEKVEDIGCPVFFKDTISFRYFRSILCGIPYEVMLGEILSTVNADSAVSFLKTMGIPMKELAKSYPTERFEYDRIIMWEHLNYRAEITDLNWKRSLEFAINQALGLDTEFLINYAFRQACNENGISFEYWPSMLENLEVLSKIVDSPETWSKPKKSPWTRLLTDALYSGEIFHNIIKGHSYDIFKKYKDVALRYYKAPYYSGVWSNNPFLSSAENKPVRFIDIWNTPTYYWDSDHMPEAAKMQFADKFFRDVPCEETCLFVMEKIPNGTVLNRFELVSQFTSNLFIQATEKLFELWVESKQEDKLLQGCAREIADKPEDSPVLYDLMIKVILDGMKLECKKGEEEYKFYVIETAARSDNCSLIELSNVVTFTDYHAVFAFLENGAKNCLRRAHEQGIERDTITRLLRQHHTCKYFKRLIKIISQPRYNFTIREAFYIACESGNLFLATELMKLGITEDDYYAGLKMIKEHEVNPTLFVETWEKKLRKGFMELEQHFHSPSIVTSREFLQVIQSYLDVVSLTKFISTCKNLWRNRVMDPVCQRIAIASATLSMEGGVAFKMYRQRFLDGNLTSLVGENQKYLSDDEVLEYYDLHRDVKIASEGFAWSAANGRKYLMKVFRCEGASDESILNGLSNAIESGNRDSADYICNEYISKEMLDYPRVQTSLFRGALRARKSGAFTMAIEVSNALFSGMTLSAYDISYNIPTMLRKFLLECIGQCNIEGFKEIQGLGVEVNKKLINSEFTIDVLFSRYGSKEVIAMLDLVGKYISKEQLFKGAITFTLRDNVELFKVLLGYKFLSSNAKKERWFREVVANNAVNILNYMLETREDILFREFRIGTVTADVILKECLNESIFNEAEAILARRYASPFTGMTIALCKKDDDLLRYFIPRFSSPKEVLRCLSSNASFAKFGDYITQAREIVNSSIPKEELLPSTAKRLMERDELRAQREEKRRRF